MGKVLNFLNLAPLRPAKCTMDCAYILWYVCVLKARRLKHAKCTAPTLKACRLEHAKCTMYCAYIKSVSLGACEVYNVLRLHLVLCVRFKSVSLEACEMYKM